jgi:hypothetical protein
MRLHHPKSKTHSTGKAYSNLWVRQARASTDGVAKNVDESCIGCDEEESAVCGCLLAEHSAYPSISYGCSSCDSYFGHIISARCVAGRSLAICF